MNGHGSVSVVSVVEKDQAKRQQEVDELRARVDQLERANRDLERTHELLSRVGEIEHSFTGKLAALVEIMNELSMTASVDELCYRAVDLARTRLGIDRLGIWFRTEEADVIAGSFGVDADGHICDERAKRVRVTPETPEGRILLSNEPFAVSGEFSVDNGQGGVVDGMTQFFAALWDGEKVIGHISADNLLRNEPLQRHHCELLRLFGSAVGYLCTRKRVEVEREKLIAELQEALANIKTLRGLIPICANCKKIRDDQGFWTRIEVYLRRHSSADFSHSLCPECAHELYGVDTRTGARQDT